MAQEQRVARAWQQKYDPDNTQDVIARQALDRTVEREKKKREEYCDPRRNPELYTILYRQNLDHATSRFRLQQKLNGEGDSFSEEAMLDAHSGEQQQQQLLLHESSRQAAAAAEQQQPSCSNAAGGIAHLPPMHRTAPYLEARCSHYTPRERYTHPEPPTSSMVVGWNCKRSPLTASNTDLYKPVRPNVMGPYRNPEDADHALLFGYDMKAK